jgi:hypothetical protein
LSAKACEKRNIVVLLLHSLRGLSLRKFPVGQIVKCIEHVVVNLIKEGPDSVEAHINRGVGLRSWMLTTLVVMQECGFDVPHQLLYPARPGRVGREPVALRNFVEDAHQRHCGQRAQSRYRLNVASQRLSRLGSGCAREEQAGTPSGAPRSPSNGYSKDWTL